MSFRSVIAAHCFAMIAVLGLAGCSGSGRLNTASGGVSTFSIMPSASTVLLGGTLQLAATGGSALSWTVNGIVGGNASVGTISVTGLYTAPTVLPQPASTVIGATAGSQTATTTLTVSSDVVVALTANSSTNPMLTGSTLTLKTTVTSAGAPSPAVTYQVNGVLNGNASVGTVTVASNGAVVYTAPSTQPSAPIEIAAVSVADPSKSAVLTRNVQGILLSQGSANPGQVLILSGQFDPTANVAITFSDAGFYSQTLTVAPSSASAVSVILPMYCTAANIGVSGTVTVTAQQTTGSNTVLIGSSPGFTLGALPAVTSGPGAISATVFQGLSVGAQEAQHMWDVLAASSAGKISSGAISKPLGDLNVQSSALMAATDTLGSKPYSLGTAAAGPVQLSSTNIGLLDAIFQAYLLNNPHVVAMAASIPAARLRAAGFDAQHMTPLDRVHALSQTSLTSFVTSVPGRDWIIIATIVELAAATPSLPVLVAAGGLAALYGAVEGFCESNAYRTAASIGDGAAPDDGFSAASSVSSFLETAIAKIGITISNVALSALAADASAAEAELNQASTTSLVSQAIAVESFIHANLPTAPTAVIFPTPSGVLTNSDGSSIIDATFTGLPDTVYQITPSWGSNTYAIQTDDFGFASIPILVPAPLPGSSCYSGSLLLQAVSGSPSVTVNGCFGGTGFMRGLLYGVLSSPSGTNLVSIDPTTGATKPVYSFNSDVGGNLGAAALDGTGGRYFLVSGDTLYVIDIAKGKALTYSGFANNSNLEYDAVSGMLYSVLASGSTRQLVGTDPNTGLTSAAGMFPSSFYPSLGTAGIDVVGRRFFQFGTSVGSGGGSVQELCILDLKNLQSPGLISAPILNAPTFDSVTSQLVGIRYNGNDLLSVNVATGVYTTLYSFGSVYTTLDSAALDATERHDFFMVAPSGGSSESLYTIDLSVGAMATKAGFGSVNHLRF